MFKNKKSSLSLSINAIVVLILAITMLGLGLGFIRTMFGKVTNIAEEQLATEPDPVVPDANNPVTLSRDMVIMNKNTVRSIKFAVYCGLSTNCVTVPPLATATCVGFTAGNPTVLPSTLSGINNEQYTKGALVITTQSTTTTAMGSCTVTVSNIAPAAKTASFTLSVK